MAQYLISVLDDTTNSATAEELVAINAFNEQLKAEGVRNAMAIARLAAARCQRS